MESKGSGCTYYTQQAILIGCSNDCDDDRFRPLLDVRRMRNYLKNNYNYECHLLEDPTADDIKLKLAGIIEENEFCSTLIVFYSGHCSAMTDLNDEILVTLKDKQLFSLSAIFNGH